MSKSDQPAIVSSNVGLGGDATEQKRDLLFATVQMQEHHDARIERVVDSLRCIQQEAEAAKRLDNMLWTAISYAATIPSEARLVDPRTWRHLLVYSTAAAQPIEREPLTDEQLDAAVAAWFREDIQPGRRPFAKRMRAAIEAARGGGWHPIETAPTDGTEFLAHKPKIGVFAALILDSDHPDCEFDGGVHCGWDHKYVEGVTHWTPLPEPPNA